jgi:hypothetical protein
MGMALLGRVRCRGCYCSRASASEIKFEVTVIVLNPKWEGASATIEKRRNLKQGSADDVQPGVKCADSLQRAC